MQQVMLEFAVIKKKAEKRLIEQEELAKLKLAMANSNAQPCWQIHTIIALQKDKTEYAKRIIERSAVIMVALLFCGKELSKSVSEAAEL